ncbi:flavin-binding monooxygenase-like domain-containing protein [Ditylenchus destructor]|nr:flavin-binding monooxygenase-like domain-containing protein [Ditylenchus destructor]
MALETRSVCVIGAGAAGLCAASRCTAAGFKVVVFEQGSTLGGSWNYEEVPNDGKVHSSMYKNLITNVPKEVMAYDDMTPFPNANFANDTSAATQSFISQEEVLNYLKEFGKPVVHLIQFDRRVVNVERIQNANNFNNFETEPKFYWKVTVERTKLPLETGAKSVRHYNFDIIFVCTGHFSVPRMPAFAKNYSKPAIHSHWYRDAKDYSGQAVCVIGAGPSGCDIALQIAEYAKKVYFSHKLASPNSTSFGPLPKNCIEVASVVDADEDALILSNGQRLGNFDCVIYCTGYKYSFPFFDSRIVSTPEDGSYVSPLFEHVVHVDYYDSLFFIGLFSMGLVFNNQVHLALAFISGALPSEKVSLEMMKRDEQERIRKFRLDGKSLKYFHFLHLEQFPYCERIREMTLSNKKNFPHLPELKPIPPVIRNIYENVVREFRRILTNFRDRIYVIVNDETFSFELPQHSLSAP